MMNLNSESEYMIKYTSLKTTGLLVLVSLLNFCGDSRYAPTNQAKSNIDQSSKALDVHSTAIPKFNCDGEGNKFSGKYNFQFTNLSAQCVINGKKDEVTHDEDFSEDYVCEQTGKDFKCKVASGNYAESKGPGEFSGCVSKDGQFKISSSTTTNDFVKAGINIFEKGDYVYIDGLATGSIRKSSGTFQYSIRTNQKDERVDCLAKASLGIQAIKD